MPSLPLPFMLPARLVAQALDDLHAIAEAARRLPTIEATLTEQFAVLNGQADRIVEMGDRFIALGEQIQVTGERVQSTGEQLLQRAEAFDRHADGLIAQGERLHERGGEILRQSELLHERSEVILSQTERVIAAAKDVANRGAEVAEALPHLQQLATTAEPLQGTIERFGRFVDRLPGAGRRAEGDDS